MLDIKTLRQDADSVVQALKKRGVEFDLPAFSALDARRKQADVRSQGLLAERKAASKKIGELVSAGSSVEEAKAQVDEALARLASDLEAASKGNPWLHIKTLQAVRLHNTRDACRYHGCSPVSA